MILDWIFILCKHFCILVTVFGLTSGVSLAEPSSSKLAADKSGIDSVERSSGEYDEGGKSSRFFHAPHDGRIQIQAKPGAAPANAHFIRKHVLENTEEDDEKED